MNELVEGKINIYNGIGQHVEMLSLENNIIIF